MKSVLITGANRGIGYGLVKQFLASKADHIFATYRQMDRSKVFSTKHLSVSSVHLGIV